MIEQDVQVLKQAEEECRRILDEARQQRLAILRAAEGEAAARREALLEDERADCEEALRLKMADVAAQRDARLRAHEQQIQSMRQRAEARMERTVSKLYEGMWEDGDRADELLQPDDA